MSRFIAVVEVEVEVEVGEGVSLLGMFLDREVGAGGD